VRARAGDEYTPEQRRADLEAAEQLAPGVASIPSTPLKE